MNLLSPDVLPNPNDLNTIIEVFNSTVTYLRDSNKDWVYNDLLTQAIKKKFVRKFLWEQGYFVRKGPYGELIIKHHLRMNMLDRIIYWVYYEALK